MVTGPPAAFRPDLVPQVAFNADPNDPAAVPVWSNLAVQFRAASGVQRGRQYELDVNQASTPSMVFRDPDQDLNPSNTSGRYWPDVWPLREMLFQAVWPNPCAGNLLNAGAQGTAYSPDFEAYTLGATVPWITPVGGTTPAISHTSPRSGVADLSWAVAGSSTVQGVSWVVPCIPGRTYTTSVYLQQTTASTYAISVVGGATGSSTTTTGSYVRLTVTFTATQPTHVVQVTTVGTATAGTAYLDDVQHEEGSSPTAFTSTGSVIYGVTRVYVERWPTTFDYAGSQGRADVTCVDAFAALAAVDLETEYVNSVLAKEPDYYWRLSESSGTTTFAESSGNSGPSLTRFDAKEGPAVAFAGGTAVAIAGDPSCTGLHIQSGPDPGHVQTSSASAGVRSPGISLTPAGGISFAMWITRDAQPSGIGSVVVWITNGGDLTGGGNTALGVGLTFQGALGPTPARVVVQTLPGGLALFVTDVWGDGKPHLYVITGSLSSGVGTTTLYVDGVSVGSTSFGSTTRTMTVVQLGSYITPYLSGSGFTAPPGSVYAHAALWGRALDSGEVADLWSAAGGYVGERSGARIARLLSYGWSGATSVDAGASVMGVSVLSGNTTSLLSACQDVTTTENGNFWVDARGVVTFTSRTTRYLALTSTYVFGEDTDAGELPYEGDIAFDFDATYAYNDLDIRNSDGFVGHATDPVSRKRFFRRTYSRNVNLLNDQEAVDAANWLINQYRNPRQRIQTIKLVPSANPALWPVVLSLEIGDRVTVKRRVPGANGGAGLVMSADFFVENIAHDNIDMTAGTWETTLLLSPAATVTPWILGDATYGVLGVTTIPGY